MEAKKNQRIVWVDIAKALAVYFMVLGHVGVTRDVNIFIHSFHMPVFFILSGYCHNESKYNRFSEFAKKRFCSLIVPYLVFGTGLFMIWNAALLLLNRKQEMRSVLNLVCNMLWVNTRGGTFGVVQWFLTCLFLTELMFFMVYKIGRRRKKNIAGILVLLSAATIVYEKIAYFRLPWALDTAFAGTVFFGIGWFMRDRHFDKFVAFIQNNVLKSSFIAALCILLSMPMIFLNGEVNMRTFVYGNGVLFFINAIVGSLLLIVISIILSCITGNGIMKRLLLVTGKNTLVILLLNSTVIRGIDLILYESIRKALGEYVYCANVFVAVIVVAVSVVISVCINKYMPALLGKYRENL